MGELVHAQRTGGVTTITLDSPHNRNALSRQLLGELHDALDDADRDAARLVVLTHNGPTFCSGADLKERSDGPTDSGPMARLIERLGTSTYPTIAALSGPVRAGGIGVMAACDLIVVHPTVTFAFTEVRIGVAPAIISVPILQRCGWSRLSGPFLTGAPFSADVALAIGLVTHVSDDVAATTTDLAEGILAGAPGAVAATKALLRSPLSMAEAQRLSEQLFSSDEAAEGMRAFAEKRPPRWAGGPA